MFTVGFGDMSGLPGVNSLLKFDKNFDGEAGSGKSGWGIDNLSQAVKNFMAPSPVSKREGCAECPDSARCPSCICPRDN